MDSGILWLRDREGTVWAGELGEVPLGPVTVSFPRSYEELDLEDVVTRGYTIVAQTPEPAEDAPEISDSAAIVAAGPAWYWVRGRLTGTFFLAEVSVMARPNRTDTRVCLACEIEDEPVEAFLTKFAIVERITPPAV